MQRCLLLLVLSIGLQFAHAQTDSRAMEVKSSFWGLKVSQNGEQISLREAQRLMEPVPDAFAAMKKARSQYAIANILSFGGGAAAGYTAATALSVNGEKSHILIGAGVAVGLLGVAIPIATSSTRNINRAVKSYNDALGYGRQQSFHLCVGFSENGLGLRVNF